MLNSGLYKLSRVHIKTISAILAESFKNDPLFNHLIPNENLRIKVLPKIFNSYFDTFFDYFDAYADSESLNGVLILYREDAEYNPKNYKLQEIKFAVSSLLAIIKEERSLKTAFHYLRGYGYMTSKWTERSITEPCMHVDFLAVKTTCRGKGIASKLLDPIIKYADENQIMITLETHNAKNVKIYNHFGFKTIQKLSTNLCLSQYCMIR